MKTLFVLVCALALSGCDKQPTLKSVADKVPVKLQCGTHSDAELEALLERYKHGEAEAITQDIIDQLKDPARALGATCLLIDSKAFLEKNGRRLVEQEIYDRIKQGLDDLNL